MAERFDRNKLILKPINERESGLDITSVLPLEIKEISNPDFHSLSRAIREAKKRKVSIVLMMGGHVIRSGVQRYLIDLMRKGFVSVIALNGAGVIHDYELALIGRTTESVSRYIRVGQFGLWKETGVLNDIVREGYSLGMGIGEAVGRYITEKQFKYCEKSIVAQAYKLGIPITVHVGIGYDIIHEHPNFDAEATGGASYLDFLAFTSFIQKLEGGVVMNFGSAVMAPEIYLEALSMARNIAHQKDKQIRKFTTGVFDIMDVPENITSEPETTDSLYYFRPLKTMLIRTVKDGGKSYYIKGRHRETIPTLWSALMESSSDG